MMTFEEFKESVHENCERQPKHCVACCSEQDLWERYQDYIAYDETKYCEGCGEEVDFCTCDEVVDDLDIDACLKREGI